MLTIYRRHRKDCKHRGKGRKYRNCNCAIWVQGSIAGESIRESLDLFGWEKAQEKVRDWEADGRKQVASHTESRLTIEECRMKFLSDLRARKLSESTVYKYELLFRQLESFTLKYRIEFLDQLVVENLGVFRSEWIDGPCSSLKKLERLRAFFHFAQQRKWVIENPANGLKAPKVPLRHTMPFTREEMIRILAALDVYAETAGITYAQRLRTFVLLLRYSGMRIGDTVQCAESRITEDRLFLYTQKTGVPVYCVLPSFVIEALNATPRSAKGFYFWSGTSKLHGSIGKWQARVKRLCEIAKVSKGHAHRFRDTFAVELLLAGVPIERVSVLLGHQSIRVTERHYAPWTRSRQEQLECDLKRAWSEDPVAIAQIQGTRQVHGKAETIN